MDVEASEVQPSPQPQDRFDPQTTGIEPITSPAIEQK
jgi:hypothetical protein